MFRLEFDLKFFFVGECAKSGPTIGLHTGLLGEDPSELCPAFPDDSDVPTPRSSMGVPCTGMEGGPGQKKFENVDAFARSHVTPLKDHFFHAGGAQGRAAATCRILGRIHAIFKQFELGFLLRDEQPELRLEPGTHATSYGYQRDHRTPHASPCKTSSFKRAPAALQPPISSPNPLPTSPAPARVPLPSSCRVVAHRRPRKCGCACPRRSRP